VSSSKSRVYFSPNTSVEDAVEICETLGMECTGNLGKYLGIPTINGRVTKATFQEVVQRVDERLAGWKTKCLSLAGRATLISSAISAIPAYIMQTSWLSQSICNELDRKTRIFLWEELPVSERHIYSMGYGQKPKESGGLGLRSM